MLKKKHLLCLEKGRGKGQAVHTRLIVHPAITCSRSSCHHLQQVWGCVCEQIGLKPLMRHSSQEFPVDTVKKVNKNVVSPREEKQEKGILELH